MINNLEQHKVYVESHKMYMIPYSIVEQAFKELETFDNLEAKLNQSIQTLTGYVKDVQPDIEALND
tara:strand:+ start:223 stop:420 length:198 start_codon:yes stop_codon:yes gene_type:complete